MCYFITPVNNCCCQRNRVCCPYNRVYFQSNVIPNNNVIIRPITPVVTVTPYVNNAMSAIGTAGAVANLAAIPLTAGAGTPDTTLNVANNALNVPAGTYLVNFGATANSSEGTASAVNVQLYANGSPVTGQVVGSNGTTTLPASASGSLIYTATAPTALSIHNTSGNSITVSNAYIVAQKLA